MWNPKGFLKKVKNLKSDSQGKVKNKNKLIMKRLRTNF